MADDAVRASTYKAAFPSPTLAEEILQAIHTLVVVINGDGESVYVSPSIKKILGYDVEEVLGDRWFNVIRSSEVSEYYVVKKQLAQAARGEAPVPPAHVRTFLTKTGEERWIHWIGSKGPGDLLIGSGQDITELRRAEEEIVRRERDFRAIFDDSSEGMLILNSDWTYIDANPRACRIVGLTLEQILGRKHGSLMKSELQTESVREKALMQKKLTLEAEFKRLDGEIRHLECSVVTNFRHGHHLIMLRDTTERRSLELQLAQAQKLEAVGRLAGGVAHDFNNMLTAIRGYGELLIKKLPDGSHRKYVDGIVGAAERAAQTTQQLLAFSRRQVMQPKLLDVNQSIHDTVDLLRHVIGEDVEMVTLFGNDIGSIMVDPGQFSQVLVNLAMNSRDAMPGGGKIVLETRAVELSDDYVLKHIQVREGPYVMLAITDTGSGIPPEIKPHIFEPFFTTKQQGQGSGLGLATVYGIVKQSGGFIWVYSELGEGTTFKLYFPQTLSTQASSTMRMPSNILVIEDDELIRTLASTVLRDQGHQVLDATDGNRALAACEGFKGALDLVITDVTAPGLSGEDLMGYFALKYPAVSIIHMSGFAQSQLTGTNAALKDSYFLSKPFSVKQLLEVVDRALEHKKLEHR